MFDNTRKEFSQEKKKASFLLSSFLKEIIGEPAILASDKIIINWSAPFRYFSCCRSFLPDDSNISFTVQQMIKRELENMNLPI